MKRYWGWIAEGPPALVGRIIECSKPECTVQMHNSEKDSTGTRIDQLQKLIYDLNQSSHVWRLRK